MKSTRCSCMCPLFFKAFSHLSFFIYWDNVQNRCHHPQFISKKRLWALSLNCSGQWQHSWSPKINKDRLWSIVFEGQRQWLHTGLFGYVVVFSSRGKWVGHRRHEIRDSGWQAGRCLRKVPEGKGTEQEGPLLTEQDCKLRLTSSWQ